MATPPMIGGSDPSVLKSLEKQTPSVAKTAPPTVSATTGSATSSGSQVARGIAPVVTGPETTYNQATQTSSGTSLTITSSTSNDPADVVTVYNTSKAISVSSVNQTVNTYKVTNVTGDAGVSQIIAGNNITITSTGANGTGNVTINSSASNVGNIAVINLDGNVSNVLHGDGTWSADQTTYGNSNVAAYLPTYTGNVGANNVNISSDIRFNDGTIATDNLESTGDFGFTTPANVGFMIDTNDGAHTWTFGSDGNLTLPNGGDFNINGGHVQQAEDQDLRIVVQDVTDDGYNLDLIVSDGTVDNTLLRIANDEVRIRSNIANSAYDWTFSDQGTFFVAGPISGNYGSNLPIYILNNVGDGVGNVELQVVDYSSTSVLSNVKVGRSNVQIGTLTGTHLWTFDDTGLLTLPDGAIIDTTGNNFEVRAIENVNFEANTVVNIYTDGSNNAYQWQFDDNGILNLAGGGSMIQSIANSSLDPTLPNVSTMVLTPDSNYTSQILVLDPTAPGHLHLRTFASSNIDQPNANLFLGGENTSFEVTSGSNNVAKIHSGGNTWTFDNTGNLNTGNIIFDTAGRHYIYYGANNYINLYNDGGMDISCNTEVKITTNYGDSPNRAYSYFYANGTFSAGGNITTSANVSGDVGFFNDLNLNNLGTNAFLYTDSNRDIYDTQFSYDSATDTMSGGNVSLTGNITVGTVTASGKIGYSTGGNATQSSTGAGVTINQLTGLVTLATRTYNAGDLEAFSISCNKISNDDFVLVQMVDSVNAPSYNVVAYPNYVLANTISVLVKTLETVGTDTPILKFMIVKAPIS